MSLFCVHVLLKCKIRQFHFVIVQRRHGNALLKERDARAKLLFCFDIKPIGFLPSSLLKLPITRSLRSSTHPTK